MRAKLCGVDRATSLRSAHRGRVLAFGSQMHVYLLEGVARVQGPAASNLPVRCDLRAVALSVHQVCGSQGQNKMKRWRVDGKRRRGLARVLVAVFAIVGGEVDRQLFLDHRSVTYFGIGRLLVTDERITEE